MEFRFVDHEHDTKDGDSNPNTNDDDAGFEIGGRPNGKSPKPLDQSPDDNEPEDENNPNYPKRRPKQPGNLKDPKKPDAPDDNSDPRGVNSNPDDNNGL